MNRTKKSSGGFTIIEMMIATVAFAVMILIVGSMLIYGWRGWVRNNDRVDMQRNASLAMRIIAREVRNSTYDSITDGAGISFSDSGAAFTESGNQIVSKDGTVVVTEGLVSGSFITRKRQALNAAGKTNQWVDINFTLQTTTPSGQSLESVPYAVEASPRN